MKSKGKKLFLRVCLALVFMLVLTGCEPRMIANGDMVEDEASKDKTEEVTTEEWSIDSLKEGVTTAIDTDTRYKALVPSKEDAEECIRYYGKKQRGKYSNPEVTEIELQMEKDYDVFAVNLGEMDIETAKDVERAFSYMYEEYPMLRGKLTNITLGNFKSSEHGKIAVTQDKEFVINKDYGICPYVVKHEIILGAGSFMNRKNLLKTCEEMVDAGHWPEKMDISALVAHELGHQVLNVIAMQEFGLTTPYYITEDNQDAYSMYLTDELAMNQTVPKKVLETAFAKWQENHEGDYEAFCAEISDYAIGRQPDGGISYPETFAEAVTDVYLNGENAADASKVICEVAKEMGED